jgi:cytochrome c biogenesis protein CcdA
MFLPFYLGLLHAVEPDHVAVVTGVSMESENRGAWKIGLAFGVSHMLAVACIALLATFMGRAFIGDRLFDWLDRGAWCFVALLGLWNLAAAFGWRRVELHSHLHHHGALEHVHPHESGTRHRFHHSAAWLGAFFGLGGVRGLTRLLQRGGIHGRAEFMVALLLFGLGITLMFMLLSLASGWLAKRLGTKRRLQQGLFAISGAGNLMVGLWLLMK